MKLIAYLRRLMLPIDAINHELPASGRVYEIGCGIGVLAEELARNYPKRSISGIDLNSEVIKNAKKRVFLPNITFFTADALIYVYKRCKGVVLSDTLHHLSFQEQERLIAKLCKVMERGGKIIIKEIDSADGLRRYLSRFWDLILYPRDKIHYRSQKMWVSLLKKIGFSVRSYKAVLWFPGSTTLIIGKKP